MPTGKRFIPFLFFLVTAMIYTESFAQRRKTETIQWTAKSIALPAIGDMEKQLGVAGVFAGVHNGVLLVAGGANFPDGMPWNGGQKRYRDDIYVLQLDQQTGFSWVTSKRFHLKQAIAYGSSITTPNGVVCLGGETGPGNFSKEVFLMQWNASKQDILFKPLPVLPVPLANTCIAVIGNSIYVGGGETNGRVSGAFYTLNVAAANPQWKILPSLPLAMSHSVAAVQFNGADTCVYVMGGRTATASGISTLHDNVFCFNPVTNRWKELHAISDGRKRIALSAGTGVSLGEDQIVLIGGDKGDIFHRIETLNVNIAKAGTEEIKQKLLKEKTELLNNHPGFSKGVYLYNTITDTWKKAGVLPSCAHVTTVAVKWNYDVFIPSGEIKPGIRIPEIMMGKIMTKKK